MKNPEEKKGIYDIWEKEEIRVLVLSSLVIQALLTFAAPFRKRSSNSCHKLSIWILYLLADAVAIYSIGLISNYKGHHFAESLELLALWGSFLLLHLGGPDTITALALEDNELWRRHALQLATQVSVTVYVFSRSFEYHTPNHLWIPTTLMFVDGFIKYFERTCALFFASRDNFRDSIMGDPEAGPNYARLMEEYFSAISAHIPADFQEDDAKGKQEDDTKGKKEDATKGKKEDATKGKKEEKKDEKYDGKDPQSSTQDNGQLDKDFYLKSEEIVRDAYEYYQMYKPLLAEGFLSLKDRTKSRDFFLSKSAEVGFRIIQIELNLIYDAFYTKSFLLQKRRAAARLVCFACVIVSLVLFCRNSDFKNQKTDAILTLILFYGAIALDISAALMFVWSDWWIIITFDRMRRHPFQSKVMGKILSFSRWVKQRRAKKRWSHTISEYNLLKYCFWKRQFLLRKKMIYNIKYVRDFIIELFYVKSKEIDDKLEEFIIEQIWKKASQADNTEVAKEVFSARGNLVLEDDYFLASECLSPWTTDIDYDESLMIWHLATDICYWREDNNNNNNNKTEAAKMYLKFSKKLSDYMLYLVIWKQSLLSSVAGMSETRFQDTCEEAKKFFGDQEIHFSWLQHLWWKATKCCRKNSGQDRRSEKEPDFFRRFSKEVLKVKAVVEPMRAKGDKSKSVLFDACRLAMQLEMFGEKQWEITSKVWLELLCYAAVRCSPRYHIAQLSKGGELITLVWLYMAHLGLGERFLKNQGFGSTKLVLEK